MAYQRTATQALAESNQVKEFAQKYSAYITDSKQYRHRVPRSPVMMDPCLDYKDYRFAYETYDEPFVEMHIPQEQFKHLVYSLESREYDAYKVEHAMTVLKQHRADESVRNSNPAVQNAWMKYLTLLELARK